MKCPYFPVNSQGESWGNHGYFFCELDTRAYSHRRCGSGTPHTCCWKAGVVWSHDYVTTLVRKGKWSQYLILSALHIDNIPALGLLVTVCQLFGGLSIFSLNNSHDGLMSLGPPNTKMLDSKAPISEGQTKAAKNERQSLLCPHVPIGTPGCPLGRWTIKTEDSHGPTSPEWCS